MLVQLEVVQFKALLYTNGYLEKPEISIMFRSFYSYADFFLVGGQKKREMVARVIIVLGFLHKRLGNVLKTNCWGLFRSYAKGQNYWNYSNPNQAENFGC